MRQTTNYIIIFITAVLILSAIVNKSYPQVTDIDGNVYKTITIGNQEWMAENLNVSHYRNGDAIPQVQDANEWIKLTTGAWCYYENKTFNGNIFGKLYNWYAVSDPRGLAPEGWHIPRDTEWRILTEYLGGRAIEYDNWILNISGKLKSTILWRSPNIGATNSSGFSAFPGGVRYADGRFSDDREKGLFQSWEYNNDSAWYCGLSSDHSDVNIAIGNKLIGGSVRCVRGSDIENVESYPLRQILSDAKKAFAEGKYLLVLELLKDFPIDDPLYFEAVTLMNQALDKLPSNSNQNFVTVSGRINCGCNKTINGYVVFEDISTRLNVGRCRITSDGYYCIVLQTGKTYSYYIDSKDFYPLSRIIDFTSSNQSLNYKDNITLVSYEEMKEQQVSVRINNIFFDFNETILKSESYLELDRMYNFLKDNPEITVEISGYTDNVGTDEYNQSLSLARAKTVKDYLVDKGISSVRITSKGYGKSNPVATNETDEGRQLNRRVEFKILK